MVNAQHQTALMYSEVIGTPCTHTHSHTYCSILCLICSAAWCQLTGLYMCDVQEEVASEDEDDEEGGGGVYLDLNTMGQQQQTDRSGLSSPVSSRQ